MKTLLNRAILLLLIALPASAQQIEFKNTATPADLTLTMPDLAKQVIAVYKEDDRGKYLDNLFRLQLIAGDYEDALATIMSLRAVLKSTDPVWAHIAYIHYEIYAMAKLRERDHKLSSASSCMKLSQMGSCFISPISLAGLVTPKT